jgi:hypothetical protein
MIWAKTRNALLIRVCEPLRKLAGPNDPAHMSIIRTKSKGMFFFVTSANASVLSSAAQSPTREEQKQESGQ